MSGGSLINRDILIKEKGTVCCNCGKNVNENIHFHHVVPLVTGGQDILSNICSICPDCHSLIHSFKMSNSEVVKKGIAKAREKGQIWGRPRIPKEVINKAIELYQEDRLSMTQIEKECDISRNTLYSYLKKYNIPLKQSK